MGGAIRLGDSHTGGGVMVEASGLQVNGTPQCVLGDHGLCLSHKGRFPLVSGGDGAAVHNDLALAFEPAQLACGCHARSSCAGQYDRR